jgi:hypothetical protein
VRGKGSQRSLDDLSSFHLFALTELAAPPN